MKKKLEGEKESDLYLKPGIDYNRSILRGQVCMERAKGPKMIGTTGILEHHSMIGD